MLRTHLDHLVTGTRYIVQTLKKGVKKGMGIFGQEYILPSFQKKHSFLTIFVLSIAAVRNSATPTFDTVQKSA